MTLSRFVAIGAILIALTIMISVGSMAANQAVAAAASTMTTVTATQTSIQNEVAALTQNVAQPVAQTSAHVAAHGNVTIGVYWQVANYTIVSGGIQPVYLGSHDDLYIPMHVMDWYTASCGTKYNITGTIYWYDYYPPYSGVGNLEVYTNSTIGDMAGTLIGPQILAFNNTGNASVPFTSLFTAC